MDPSIPADDSASAALSASDAPQSLPNDSPTSFAQNLSSPGTPNMDGPIPMMPAWTDRQRELLDFIDKKMVKGFRWARGTLAEQKGLISNLIYRFIIH
jgi:hypothetical protein